MTEFFFDLINKIQLRQVYILLACLFPLPHILHQARLQQGKSWRWSARDEATPDSDHGWFWQPGEVKGVRLWRERVVCSNFSSTTCSRATMNVKVCNNDCDECESVQQWLQMRELTTVDYGQGKKGRTCADVDTRTCNDAIMREESDTCGDMNLKLTLVEIWAWIRHLWRNGLESCNYVIVSVEPYKQGCNKEHARLQPNHRQRQTDRSKIVFSDLSRWLKGLPQKIIGKLL